MQGILLIGMPGSGKTTVGKTIAKQLGFRFFDGDAEIEKKLPERQKFLDAHGDEAYVKMEEKVVTKLPVKDSVLSPGGSIVYSEKAMNYLGSCFKVFLNVPFNTVQHRLSGMNIRTRGIVRLKKIGLKQLYRERTSIYRKYADIVIDSENKSVDYLAKAIVNAYAMRQLVVPKKPIKYVSTNGKSTASFREALFRGLAPDKGLFVPLTIPVFSKEEIGLMEQLSYAQLAFVVTRKFVDIDDDALRKMCEESYDFGIPIEHHKNLFIARLDQGPSASFKDFGMQLLAAMMDYTAKKTKKKLMIITATSGDTGGAVAAAFHGRKNVNAIILMPEKEITARQRKQMTTFGGNITAVLVNGKFDDCQRIAKQSLAEIKELSSANSINVGRLIPQIVYYFYVYCRTKAGTVVVPSGNFGNLVAGAIGKKMGMPIRFVAAVNENDEVPRFMETGKYVPVVPSRKCISNAMNVGNPSNLARLVRLYGGNMKEDGTVVKIPDMKELKADISSVSITDEETREAMVNAYKKGIVLEPHGAVGFAAVRKLRRIRGSIILFETAHPAKFPKELDALNISYDVPPSLSRLDNLKEKYVTINPEIEELRKIIEKSKRQYS